MPHTDEQVTLRLSIFALASYVDTAIELTWHCTDPGFFFLYIYKMTFRILHIFMQRN